MGKTIRKPIVGWFLADEFDRFWQLLPPDQKAADIVRDQLRRWMDERDQELQRAS